MAVLVASVSASFLGFTPVSANNATIKNTGPGSDNSISYEVDYDCDIENRNNVSVDNDTNQFARTGDATVAGNTGAFSTNWGSWDPAVWQAKGYSYDQWHSAFTSYMKQNSGSWKSNWGSLSGGGSATTGDATNVSSNNTTVVIDNSGGEEGVCNFPGSKNGGTIDTTGPGSDNHINGVLGSKTDIENRNNILGSNDTRQGAVSGNAFSGYNTSGGHGATGSASNGSQNTTKVDAKNPGSGGKGSNDGGDKPSNNASINNTGPKSDNSITYVTKTDYKVNNTNNVVVTNNTSQNAKSGNATVKNNTSGNGAGSGSAGNTAGNGTNVGLNN